MGLIYLDASVLVALLVSESNSRRAAAWFSDLNAAVIVSDLANLEVSAVLLRGQRAQRLTRPAAEEALLDFDALRAGCERWSHSPADFGLAAQFVRNFSTKLLAPDALHLASAKNAGAELATFDLRLAEAAEAEGIGLSEIR